MSYLGMTACRRVRNTQAMTSKVMYRTRLPAGSFFFGMTSGRMEEASPGKGWSFRLPAEKYTVFTPRVA